MAHLEAVSWMDPVSRVGDQKGWVRLIDQTLLPAELKYHDCKTVEMVWEAIRSLRVRGAPAIGVAAAFGVVLGVQNGKSLREVCDYLRTSRPTAVNLFWALDRMEQVGSDLDCLLSRAKEIQDSDRKMCEAIGLAGASLIRDNSGVLTHCNTGVLATAGIGTAIAVMTMAHQQGRHFRVYADETRPLLQGARLTAWEMTQQGIPVTLICDNMAAQVMKEGRIQLVIVGADRITANGDTANKIGTYGVAVLARAHGIPFYVAAPTSTFDLSLSNGKLIPIEERDSREVTHGFGKQTGPDGVDVYNPAFDVTPASLITGIITERGIIQPVDEATIRELVKT